MSVIWGLPYLLIKVAVGGVSVPVLVLARVALGAALLLPFALRRKEFGALKPVWPWLLLFAVVEIIMPWFALSEAERGISSSLTGLLIASVPIIVAVLSLFLSGGGRLSPVRWIGLIDEQTQQVIPVMLAGEEPDYLSKIQSISIAATNDARQVITDAKSPYYGVKVSERSLTPDNAARLAPTCLDDWLRQHAKAGAGSV
jgi:hypothetical protein